MTRLYRVVRELAFAVEAESPEGATELVEWAVDTMNPRGRHLWLVRQSEAEPTRPYRPTEPDVPGDPMGLVPSKADRRSESDPHVRTIVERALGANGPLRRGEPTGPPTESGHRRHHRTA